MGRSEEKTNEGFSNPTNVPTANPTASPTANPTLVPTPSPSGSPWSWFGNKYIITWILISRKTLFLKIDQKVSIYFSWNWLTVKVSMSFNMALVRGYSSLRASISSISAKSPWRARFWFVFGMVWMSCAIENIYIVSKIGENYSKILIPVKKSKITCFNVLPNIEGNVWCFS